MKQIKLKIIVNKILKNKTEEELLRKKRRRGRMLLTAGNPISIRMMLYSLVF